MTGIQTNQRKRIEIFVDRALLRRVRDMAVKSGVNEYTIMPTIGGSTEGGRWNDDQVTGGAASKVMITAYLEEELAEKFLIDLRPYIEQYGLYITISPVEILVHD